MLIINADDYGRCRLATDRIFSCWRRGIVTSTSAMVFMGDSQRAADLAKEHSIDVGLHLNFTQELMQATHNLLLCDYHERIARFLTRSKYNVLIYNPALSKQFEYVSQVQFEEFVRLYGKSPSHIDGHHHMHLCANMLIKNQIPKGQKVRRNFTFACGEKGFVNRMYRRAIDKFLSIRYLLTDHLFSLSDRIARGRLSFAIELAKTSSVELQTHPEVTAEYDWLMKDDSLQLISNVKQGTYAQSQGAAHLAATQLRNND
jgi:predicted glycoside hydrolase/deacetylase ChbG (UPF0249 family)